MVDFAVIHHCTHQSERFRRDGEAESRAEARHAQDTYRVFLERGSDMAQDAGLQVGNAVVRINDQAAFVACDGVDSEVAARQILFQRDFGRGVDLEAAVATSGLALGACQRIFLVRARVKEHRKVPAHRAIAELSHLFRRCADHHVILVGSRSAKQPVAHRPSDRIDFHSYCGLTSVSACAATIHSRMDGNA